MFKFQLHNSDHRARSWTFTTPHGKIETPVFMPVGTKASVKGISQGDLDEMGAQIILNNTYHLYLRPGDEVIKKFWGVHSFQNYHKPILTDSGWFQVFSLGSGIRKDFQEGKKDTAPLVKVTEQWVHFRSVIDGSKHFFSPEKVMDIESNLGADIIMAFDECSHGQSTHLYAKKAMLRTHEWLERCIKQWKINEYMRKENWLHPQALFGIIQWVIFDDLRIESTKFVAAQDLPGIAIWGLSVGESKEDMYRILDVLEPHLPKNKPRYLMGVGTPRDLIEAIYRGVDMFDCVLPTRIGRHGTAFSDTGKDIKVKNEQYKLSDKKLVDSCSCKVCKNYSTWYLRHLVIENEMLWLQLLSYHNLYFLIDLTKKAKKAIEEHAFEQFRENFILQNSSWKS